MLLTGDGWAAGSISGGCLEGDLVQSAFDRTEHGPALVTYDATADEDILWGFGLGCNGMVKVFLERMPPDGGALAQIEDAFLRRSPLILTVGDFVQEILPPRSLVVCGAGHDAIPLVDSAKALGWRVTVVDPRPSYANRARFSAADEVLASSAADAISHLDLDPETAVVIMAHHYLNDLASLRETILSAAGYVGLLGPARRTQKLIDDLRSEGVLPTVAQLARLRAPIGLDLGSDGPDEIALAVVAEIQAFFRGRSGGPLTARYRADVESIPEAPPLAGGSFPSSCDGMYMPGGGGRAAMGGSPEPSDIRDLAEGRAPSGPRVSEGAPCGRSR